MRNFKCRWAVLLFSRGLNLSRPLYTPLVQYIITLNRSHNAKYERVLLLLLYR